MRTVEHTIHIDASPDTVWATLADLPGWPRWNVVRPTEQAVLEVGARFPLRIHIGRIVVPATATLDAVEPGSELCWRGGVPGLFHAVHGFSLTADGDGCRVRHHETFTGWLVAPILRMLGLGHYRRYEQVNDDLKRCVEDSEA